MRSDAVRRLLACAAFMVAVFSACHLAGLRESTSYLCRIDISTQPSQWKLFGLGLYLASYLGCVVMVPILLIASLGCCIVRLACPSTATGNAPLLWRRSGPASSPGPHRGSRARTPRIWPTTSWRFW